MYMGFKKATVKDPRKKEKSEISTCTAAPCQQMTAVSKKKDVG